MYSRYGVLDVEGGGNSDAEWPPVLAIIMSHVSCFYPMALCMVVWVCLSKTQPLTNSSTSILAIALRATCHKTITICSIYLSPSTACNITELENLIGQLPPPVLLLGDFSTHSQQWGSNKRSSRGKMVEDFLLKSNVSLLNSGSPCYCIIFSYRPQHNTSCPLFGFLLAN